jgi:membrane protein implicated in regulation of membrane protease activity
MGFDWATLGALQCVYLAMLAVGFMYALAILVGGEIHDLGVHVDLPGHFDLGGDFLHGEVGIMSLSPITIAGFVTAFGAFGLIGPGLFGASGGASLVWATLGGVVVGLAGHLVFIYVFVKPQGSSEVTKIDLVGATAEVITPIPEGRVGEIAVVAQGARFTMTARSADKTALARGTPVVVADVVGSVAMVRPRD